MNYPRFILKESSSVIPDGRFDEENRYSNWNQVSNQSVSFMIETLYAKKLRLIYEDRNGNTVEFCPLFIEVHYLDETIKNLSIVEGIL
jgi:hypothetical protein